MNEQIQEACLLVCGNSKPGADENGRHHVGKIRRSICCKVSSAVIPVGTDVVLSLDNFWEASETSPQEEAADAR